MNEYVPEPDDELIETFDDGLSGWLVFWLMALIITAAIVYGFLSS